MMKPLSLFLLTSAVVSSTYAKPLLLKQKTVHNVHAKNKKEKLAYPSDLLTNNFTSWGIDPSNSSASINLKESWKNFKKVKDVIVAVIDTGIQQNHPFLKENVYTN